MSSGRPQQPDPTSQTSPRHRQSSSDRNRVSRRHSASRHGQSESQTRQRRESLPRRESNTRRQSGTRNRHTSDTEATSPRSPQEGRRSRRSSDAAQRPQRSSGTAARDYPTSHSGLPRRPSARRTSASHGAPTITRSPPRTYDNEKRAVPEVYVSSMPSPGHLDAPSDPMLEAGHDMRRKRSLIRPDRRRNDPDDPNYYYRQHAQHMNIMPSITGNDPQLEEDFTTISSDTAVEGRRDGPETSPTAYDGGHLETVKSKGGSRREPNKLVRKKTVTKPMTKEERIMEKKRLKSAEHRPPTLWGTYCSLITFWAPGPLLRCIGFRTKPQQRAWREKMGLISIILLVATFVGFLTFGFTQTVCPGGGPTRLRVNHVGDGYMIFHGKAYDLTRSQHPLARGIGQGGNVLWDMSEPHGGQDGSFLFQNVNGACKNLITRQDNSDVPTNSDGDLAWYFPCNTFNQDGSTKPNKTIPYYLGYSCHTSRGARENFYDMKSAGDVFFTWNDITNSSRNLMVYSGDVLDLDLLEWFNTTQVAFPSEFNDIRQNPEVRGKDMTLAFQVGGNKQIAECFQDIIKVGSIDTDTVGCIASKVVLYVSLIFILGIVVIKFVLALIFQWFLCRRYAADRTSMGTDAKKRKQQIEDWTDDIYRPPPKMTDPATTSGYGSPNKRSSFLPTTSRFTSPYAIEKIAAKSRPPPTTMASQNSTARLLPAGGGMYGQPNRSEGTLLAYTDSNGGKTNGTNEEPRQSIMESRGSATQQRYSSVMHTEPTDSSGPQGFIHEAVVPQPPPEWQPFGFPLAHSINLITCYSEGPEAIRTTLDSIAMTDYPNSHKLMFVVCDGLIKGKGESMSTPEACISMLRDPATLPDEVQAFSYVAVASGSKRHNMAKVYAGFYDYGHDSIIPLEKQQRVPMIIVVKCGTPEEASSAKPGNRGKRDSQIILMSFLQKVMFDERMTELEYEMFNGIWKITGISPDFYEIVLMVDADTKVFPDSVTHMVSAMVKDPEIMGLCGETKIANKTKSWVTMIQVFEYFISHHQAKSFESVFGGVTCLPGCFCMYRIKAPKGGQNYWVPILANPDIVEHYSENVVETLHEKNLLLLGEDRYLSTLMLKTFPKRKQVFVPQAVCKTTVPEEFRVLLSQRRRWINSTVHNLMELVLVRDLCGTFCFSMQFVVFIELVGTLVLPAAISFTIYVGALGIKAAITHTAAPVIPLVLLALILGLPGFLIVMTAHRFSYVLWMLVYLLSLPIWNLILPVYAYWHFDDFSWGDTRKAAGTIKGADKAGHSGEGEFDSSKITMKRWGDFEQERRLRGTTAYGYGSSTTGTYQQSQSLPQSQSQQSYASYGGYGGYAAQDGFQSVKPMSAPGATHYSDNTPRRSHGHTRRTSSKGLEYH